MLTKTRLRTQTVIYNDKQSVKTRLLNVSPPKKQEKFLLNFLLGGFSGAIAKTAVAPTERIKLILQTSTSQVARSSQRQFTGITDCFRKVIRSEGFASLWKGNGVNVMKCFPMNAFSLALKDFFSKRIRVENPQQNKMKYLFASMLSGGLAGACTITLVFPLDFARTRLSTDVVSGGKRQFSGFADCVTQIVRKDGIFGLYKGISMALTGVCLSKALILGTYDFLKQGPLAETNNLPFYKKFLIANAVTQTTQLLLYPLDTVGRALMMQSGSAIKLYKNPVDCFKKIVRRDGIKGLYRGCRSDMISGIGASLILVLYDDMKKCVNSNQY